ncbi:hypothetical protein C5167_007454 [Papaver somniferum]|uniref:ferritin-2, chloroplastic-like n=1 Tax=Papaver somniferum TaxID=3469 RepID=UPI000E7025BA|nr:ferritin-2, chloroplastic-like [Papaver somniferum]RZC86268.1 hypothetical protein C5167_007454 [Papaver somniferum]
MFLRASPSTAFSLSTAVVDNVNQFTSSSSSSVSLSSSQRRTDGFVMSVSGNQSINNPSPVTTGVVFEPFVEVQKELQVISDLPQEQSLARHKFSNVCEAAINDHINWEYNLSYVYHGVYAYLDRDYVALEGFAKFFKGAIAEKRERAELLIEYQNKRGGRVKLDMMLMPTSEFDHSEKGEALYAMEFALFLEKSTNTKLLQLHSIADENNDVQLAEFVESNFLREQVEAIKKISEFVAELRRVGKGYGVWHFDQMLLNT